MCLTRADVLKSTFKNEHIERLRSRTSVHQTMDADTSHILTHTPVMGVRTFQKRQKPPSTAQGRVAFETSSARASR